jgi:hypothetical protein
VERQTTRQGSGQPTHGHVDAVHRGPHTSARRCPVRWRWRRYSQACSSQQATWRQGAPARVQALQLIAPCPQTRSHSAWGRPALASGLAVPLAGQVGSPALAEASATAETTLALGWSGGHDVLLRLQPVSHAPTNTTANTPCAAPTPVTVPCAEAGGRWLAPVAESAPSQACGRLACVHASPTRTAVAAHRREHHAERGR